MNIAQKIRQFLRDLLGSRLVARLEEDLLRLRADYDARLNERDETIADLRDQLAQLRAKLDTYEVVLLPLTSPVGNLFNPKPRTQTLDSVIEPEGSWARTQREWYAQQNEDNLSEKQPGEEVQQ